MTRKKCFLEGGSALHPGLPDNGALPSLHIQSMEDSSYEVRIQLRVAPTTSRFFFTHMEDFSSLFAFLSRWHMNPIAEIISTFDFPHEAFARNGLQESYSELSLEDLF